MFNNRQCGMFTYRNPHTVCEEQGADPCVVVCPPFTFMAGLIARAGALQAVMSDLTLEEEM